MARGDIRQRISLDGGEEVKRQLAQMGNAGEVAIREMDRAVNSANADLGRFAATVAATRAGIATMHASFATAGAGLGTLHGSVTNFGNAMRASAATILPFNVNMLAMVGAVTAAVAPLALFAQAKKAALATDSLVDTAENLKVTTEELVALRQVSEASGASFDVLENAMQKGNRTLGEAAAKEKGFQTAIEGGTTALRGNADALSSNVEVIRGATRPLVDVANEYAVIARLAGTTIQALTKMNPIDRVLAEGKAIGMVKDETEQARLANAAWGKSYRDMLPALRDATTLLKPAIARVKEFGQGVSDAEKAQSEGFLQALARTNTAMGRMFTTLGGTLGTTMVPVFQELERAIVANRLTIEAWATSISGKVMPVVQDFVALVRGDELKTDFVKGLVSAFEQIKAGATIAFGVIKAGFLAVSKVLEPVALAINAAFGTEFTGKSVAIGAALLYMVGGFTVLAAGVKVVGAAIALAFGAPIVALIAGIAIAIASIDVEALKSGKTLQELKDTWGALQGVFGAIEEWAGRWFRANIVKPAQDGIDWINALIVRKLFLDKLFGFQAKENEVAFAKIPGLPTVGAEQFDAHVRALKDAASANTQTLQKTVVEQTAALTKSVNSGVTVIRGGVQEMGKEVGQAVGQAVAQATDWASRIKTAEVGGATGLRPGETYAQKAERHRREDSQLQVGGTIPNRTASQWNAESEAINLQKSVAAQKQQWEAEANNLLQQAVAEQGAALGLAMENGMVVVREATGRLKAEVTAQGEALQAGVTASTGMLQTSVDTGVNVIRDGYAVATATIQDQGLAVGGAVAKHVGAFATALTTENALIKSSTAVIDGYADAARDVANDAAQAAYGGGFARGGLIRGPGTGTSDSILARVSNREYINTARSVDFWGADFFEQLNRLENPFKGFALGGLVDAMNTSLMPRSRGFRSPGLVAAGSGGGGGTPVYLQIHGGKAVGPMIADRDVLGALHREAKRATIFSAGRAPSSVG